LVRSKVDVIVAVIRPAILAAKHATKTIPIVMNFWGSEGLVESGIVASFARPGGNITGVYMLAAELDAKRFELLLEALPNARRIACSTGATACRSRGYAKLREGPGSNSTSPTRLARKDTTASLMQ